MAEVILWDSCIIIDAIQNKEQQAVFLDDMVRRAESGDLFIVISAASIAEVTYLRELASAGLSQQDQNKLIQQWLNSTYIIPRNADRGICEYAASLARDVGAQGKSLTPIDSIILATALRNKATALITLDDGKSSSNVGLLELNQRFGEPRLDIITPEDYYNQRDTESAGQVRMNFNADDDGEEEKN